MPGFSRLFGIVTVAATAAGAATVQALRFGVADGAPGAVAEAHIRPNGGSGEPDGTIGGAVSPGSSGRVATHQHHSACLHDVETLFRPSSIANAGGRRTPNRANLCTMLRMSLLYAGPDRYAVGWQDGRTGGRPTAPANSSMLPR